LPTSSSFDLPLVTRVNFIMNELIEKKEFHVEEFSQN
jgi:hypothetical protein